MGTCTPKSRGVTATCEDVSNTADFTRFHCAHSAGFDHFQILLKTCNAYIEVLFFVHVEDFAATVFFYNHLI